MDDYDTLLDLLVSVDQVFVTPNTLTEASNMLAQHGEPERSRFFHTLRFLIQKSEEVVVASETVSSDGEFGRLGLTDSALLEVVSAETPVVTVDLDLYLEAVRKGQNAAVNFTHLRNLA